MGFNFDAFIYGDYRQLGQDIDAATIEGFFQTWLWFGTIHAFFDRVVPIEEDRLVRWTDTNDQVLDSSCLVELLLEWYRICKTRNVEEQAEYAEYLDNFFLELRFKMVDDLFLGETSHLSQVVSLETRCAVIILLETLESARATLYEDGHAYTFSHHTDTLLYQRLRELYWCPWEIQELKSNLSRHYASLLGPKFRQSLHTNCDAGSCAEAVVDDKTYVPQHLTSSCVCEHLTVDVDEVIAAISEDQLPVVLWDESTERLAIKRVDPKLHRQPGRILI
ncbi:hypothetical protein VKT23_015378 [Stygiomarasmius scandens]|uniref:Uncharacterized protein n=1 Tax=Marasmiellus scandens TaxID=2682957 RepID=A0ABR1IZJ7_9AGAR